MVTTHLKMADLIHPYENHRVTQMTVGLTHTHHTHSFRSEYNEAENKRLSIGKKKKPCKIEKATGNHRKGGQWEREWMVWSALSGRLKLAKPTQWFVLGSNAFESVDVWKYEKGEVYVFKWVVLYFGRLPTDLLGCYLSSWRERKVYRRAMKTGDSGFTGKRRAYLSAGICCLQIFSTMILSH